MAKIIPLTRGKVTIVDDDVYEWASKFKWCVCQGTNTLYAKRGVGGFRKQKTVRLHREILPGAKQIDHINGDGLDNRKVNLRHATSGQNRANRQKWPGTTSKFKGVSWNSARQKWQSQIDSKGRRIYLGLFKSEESAARMYDYAAEIYFGEFAKLNFSFNS